MDFDWAIEIVKNHTPEALFVVIVMVIAITVIISALLKNLREIIESMSQILAKFQPRGNKDLVRNRMNFCDSLNDRLKQINKDERWSDRNYTELEAEVESETSYGFAPILRLLLTADGRRREPSLSRAMRNSKDRLVLLEGDPGSGKSVALRHVALNFANRAKRSRKRTEKIALYISLKEFRPSTPGAPTSQDLKDYIFRYYAELDEIKQVKYLKENFDQFMSEGIWIFLFDSFDEIPEVLSAIEVNDTVDKYARAVSAFLQSANPCHAVIASREYRGPRGLLWPKYRISRLSASRRAKLIQLSQLDPTARRIVQTDLPYAPANIRALADNAMFLNLLCEYVQKHRTFPDNTHSVFESYVDNCLLEHGSETLFGQEPAVVRNVGQQIAFCMVAEPSLGLSAHENDLTSALARQGFSCSPETVKATVAALRRVRLARSEHSVSTLTGPPFSFAHRRFQEYFATCQVLISRDLVQASDLLLNGRWRETAVTVLQSQTEVAATDLLATAKTLLRDLASTVPEAPSDFAQFQEMPASQLGRFEWPPQSYHILSLLDAGLGKQNSDQELSNYISRIVDSANVHGTPVDQLWITQVAGAAPLHSVTFLLQNIFKQGSALLREAAFHQIGRLHPLPQSIRREIFLALLTYSINGQLRRDSQAIEAQLHRLDRPDKFNRARALLHVAARIDLGAILVLELALLMRGYSLTIFGYSAVFAAASIWALALIRAAPEMTWSVDGMRLRLLVVIARGTFGIVVAVYATLITRTVYAILLFTALSEASTVASVMVLFALSWAPSVFLIIRVGYLPRVLSWVFPQAVLCLAFLRVAIELAKQMKLRLLLATAGRLAVTGIVAGLFLLVIKFVGQRWLFLAIAGLAAVGSVVALAFLARAILFAVIDFVKAAQLLKSPPPNISDNDVLALFSDYRTANGRFRALRVLRQSKAFVSSPEATFALSELMRINARLIHKAKGDATRSPITSIVRRLFVPKSVKHDKSRVLELDAVISSELVADWILSDEFRNVDRLRGLHLNFWDEATQAVNEAMIVASGDSTYARDESLTGAAPGRTTAHRPSALPG